MELEILHQKEKNQANISSWQYTELLHKTTRLIRKFIIPSPNVEQEYLDKLDKHLNEIRTTTEPSVRREKLLTYIKDHGSTATSLEALVSCFEKLNEENLLTEEFTVDGYGRISFRRAFRHVRHGPTTGFTIYYGGARLVKRYGVGFLLTFMDKITEPHEGTQTAFPITLYVPQEALKSYRPAKKFIRMIEEIERNKKSPPYLKIYWIGKLSKNEHKNTYECTVSALPHLVMRLVYPSEAPKGNFQTIT